MMYLGCLSICFQKVKIQVYKTREKCLAMYAENPIITAEKKTFSFCAGGMTAESPDEQKVKKDTCEGDSGGPLECVNKGYIIPQISKARNESLLILEQSCNNFDKTSW